MRTHLTFTWLTSATTVAGLAIATCLATSTFAQQRSNRDENQDSQQYESYDARDNRRETSSDQQNRDAQRDGQADSNADRDRRSNREAEQRRQEEQGDQRNQQSRNSEQDRFGGLGITIADGQQGLRVLDVMPNSPAQQAGIRRGDEVVSLNDRDARSPQQFVDLVRRQDPGSEVDIRFIRNGEVRTLRATLETRQEALNLRDGRNSQPRDGQQQWQEERYYRGSSPPWGDDEIMRHVQGLEQEIRMLTREIRDLRTMLEDDPSTQQFEVNQQSSRSGARRQESGQDREYRRSDGSPDGNDNRSWNDEGPPQRNDNR